MAKTKTSGYIDTGRELPPIHHSETVIIISKELAELECARLGLEPPVAKLSERPSSYNANGWLRVGSKWIAGQPAANSGMLVRQPVFRATNGFVRA